MAAACRGTIGSGVPVPIAHYTELAFRLSNGGMSTPPVTRPLRADARRNRERVLEAARACFREDGSNAQMDDVASRAGVGVGTVYRHFPDKAALLEALISERFREFAED